MSSTKSNNYKSNDGKHLNIQLCFQEHIFEHFNIDTHIGILENVLITFIDKTDP